MVLSLKKEKKKKNPLPDSCDIQQEALWQWSWPTLLVLQVRKMKAIESTGPMRSICVSSRINLNPRAIYLPASPHLGIFTQNIPVTSWGYTRSPPCLRWHLTTAMTLITERRHTRAALQSFIVPLTPSSLPEYARVRACTHNQTRTLCLLCVKGEETEKARKRKKTGQIKIKFLARLSYKERLRHVLKPHLTTSWVTHVWVI